jgi:hypothetical protein
MNQLKQIVFEVEETVVLRSGEMTTAGYCPLCGETVAMATPWIAAALSNSNEREIFRLIEAGVVHFIEEDRLLVCLNSMNVQEGEVKK